ncbi:MAG: S9 family peptidase [Pseudomonadota bacterium]
MTAKPPIAEKRPVTSTHHGQTLVDDYAWLRADNWQEAMREPEKLPEPIAAYLRAENAYQEACLADTADRRAALVEEMKGRIKEDDSSVPQLDGPYQYWVEYREGGEYPVYKRRPRDADAGTAEQILLDGDLEGKDKAYFSLGGMDRSPSHKLGAWIVDENGSEYYRLRVRDLETAQDTGETLEDVGSFVFTDDETLYYALVDESHRPSKIFRHTLGTAQADDVLVYEETDPRFFCGVGISQSERFLFISASVNDQDELHFLDLADPEATLTCMQPRQDGVEYGADHMVQDGEDLFIIRTNADGAEDFKLVTAPIAAPGRANWTDLVPHKAGCTILSADPLKNWLVRMERENALPRIVVRHLPTGEEHAIAFDEETYALGADTGEEWDSDTLRLTYASPTTPSQTWDYNMATRERTLRKEQEVPSGHDASQYVTRRLMVPSHDGELVPATVLHRADLELDGSAPCFLYAYGSYGASMPASFSTVKFSLVDRGWVHVTAHIRGGAEKGRGWYEQSKKGGKHHTFKDFIAVGEYLASQNEKGEGFTARGKIVANGGSAGGLLMGAVANMAPDLFAGIVADVPFVDVLNTILDASLPLTPGEWSQWGNPIESAEEYAIIASYSPYDNVTAQAYPPMLVTAGVSDPRVTYWEPAKWVSKLRATKTDDNPLYLKTNMTSGHFGKTGRFAGLDDTALTYDFAMRSVGETA